MKRQENGGEKTEGYTVNGWENSKCGRLPLLIISPELKKTGSKSSPDEKRKLEVGRKKRFIGRKGWSVKEGLKKTGD